MDAPYIYKCMRCGHIESIDAVFWRCPLCQGQWHIETAFLPDMLPVNHAAGGLWRYRNAIPVPASAEPVTLGEPVSALTKHTIGDVEIYLKHEYQFPSGSFKDRGASVMITMAKHLGVDSVIVDSSGNAGAAVAAYSACAGIRCRVFVPASNSKAKLRQISAYGAYLEPVPGTREDTAKAAVKAAADGFYASHYRHPLFLHGVKTMAFEMWEQLGKTVPGTIVVPVGNGSLILGLITGFNELAGRGMTQTMPRVIGVQAANCCPVTDLFHKRHPETAYSTTVAEGIAVAEPFLGETIVELVRDTGGDMMTVTDDEIGTAWTWAWQQGLCIEKTSAAALAGVRKWVAGNTQPARPVVTVLTGHGLKNL
jgi:threonine synthase